MSRAQSWGRTLLGLALLGSSGCTNASASNKEAGEKPQPKMENVNATRVEVARVSKTGASMDLRLPGEVEGGREAVLASPRGGQVEQVAVQDGDRVKNGQLLVQVDTTVYHLQVEQAEAELEQAKKDLERADKLGGIMTQSERERIQLQVRLLTSKLKLARLELSRSMIRAPFAGVVAELDVERGEVVGPATPVLRLLQLDPIKVILSVPDRDVVALTAGTNVDISVGARSGVVKGKITQLIPAGDRKTRSFKVEIAADNSDASLLPGMIASVAVKQTLSEGAVVVPQDWLVTQRDKVGVFVVDKQNVARWRDVQAGQIVREQVVIRNGLKPGDRVVTTGQRSLADGDPLILTREGTCCKNGRVQF